jgi:hypothetical protein
MCTALKQCRSFTVAARSYCIDGCYCCAALHTDADWHTVWRYMPILTAGQYWQRLSSSYVLMSAAEQTDILEQHTAGQCDAAAASSKRWRTVSATLQSTARHWCFDSAALKSKHYTHLPQRLRSAWFSYHRQFAKQLSVSSDALREVLAAHNPAAAVAAAVAAEPEKQPLRVPQLLQQQQQQAACNSSASSASTSSSSRGAAATDSATAIGEELAKQQRQQCLAALNAAFSSFVKHGRITGSAQSVLRESTDAAQDRVEAGGSIELCRCVNCVSTCVNDRC